MNIKIAPYKKIGLISISYITKSTSLFENLEPYFYLDREISLNEFVSGAMDGGLFRGGAASCSAELYDPPVDDDSRATGRDRRKRRGFDYIRRVLRDGTKISRRISGRLAL